MASRRRRLASRGSAGAGAATRLRRALHLRRRGRLIGSAVRLLADARAHSGAGGRLEFRRELAPALPLELGCKLLHPKALARDCAAPNVHALGRSQLQAGGSLQEARQHRDQGAE
eukprot:CAMPEP_0175285408 /NCGR_PEP_ID=MMETSP0093-20121207/53219_1 /TAXON_ID=311494 /ORGANISM="Alexandrium monilatum, Strain CCMP3105" /LENGTH=114 /DNA_ID=CAMNT_0016580815 /DNA_START=102 /DNA_END=443 /DNA_ORIENTATION=-